jgi:hypothetical protein
VLIAPKDSKIDNVNIGAGFDLAKLAGDGKIATGDVKSVPVGKYAKAALEKLGSWQAAEPKFAMAESVRAALTLVARGEAALGIVYSTDAKVEPGVKVVGTFPADSHPAIIYPVAATTTAKAGDGGLSRLPALDRGEDHPREIRLQVSRQPLDLMFDISPAEWTAILLRCGWPSLRRWWRRRSASRWRGCWRGVNSGASPSSMRQSICRWCCRRSSPAICCC